MMLLYGVLRGISAFIRRLAEWKHDRMQKAYETAEVTFRDLETSCKAHEVALGRPLDSAQHFRLLKAYERREIARDKWVESAENVTSQKNVEGKVRSFSSMRLPYTFGLLDMAFIMKMLDHLGLLPQIDQPLIETVYAMLFQ